MAGKNGSTGPFARLTGLFGKGKKQAEAERAEAEARIARERAEAEARAAEEAARAAAAAVPQTINVADFVAEMGASRPKKSSAPQEFITDTAVINPLTGETVESYTIGTVFKSSYEFAGDLAAHEGSSPKDRDADAKAIKDDTSDVDNADGVDWPTAGVVSISDLFGNDA